MGKPAGNTADAAPLSGPAAPSDPAPTPPPVPPTSGAAADPAVVAVAVPAQRAVDPAGPAGGLAAARAASPADMHGVATAVGGKTAAVAADEIADATRHLAVFASANGGGVSIRLHDAALGMVEVRVATDDAHRARLSVLSDRADTLDTLQRDQDALRVALAAAGVGHDGTISYTLRDTTGDPGVAGSGGGGGGGDGGGGSTGANGDRRDAPSRDGMGAGTDHTGANDALATTGRGPLAAATRFVGRAGLDITA